jgi:hypothetical protein
MSESFLDPIAAQGLLETLIQPAERCSTSKMAKLRKSIPYCGEAIGLFAHCLNWVKRW